MRNMTPEQRAELEEYGSALADKMQADDYEAGPAFTPGALPAALALRDVAVRRAVTLRRLDEEMQTAVDAARAEGLSWHKVAIPLGMTAEGARKRFAHT